MCTCRNVVRSFDRHLMQVRCSVAFPSRKPCALRCQLHGWPGPWQGHGLCEYVMRMDMSQLPSLPSSSRLLKTGQLLVLLPSALANICWALAEAKAWLPCT